MEISKEKMFLSHFNLKKIWSKIGKSNQKKEEYANHRGYEGKTVQRRIAREWATMHIRKDPELGVAEWLLLRGFTQTLTELHHDTIRCRRGSLQGFSTKPPYCTLAGRRD